MCRCVCVVEMGPLLRATIIASRVSEHRSNVVISTRWTHFASLRGTQAAPVENMYNSRFSYMYLSYRSAARMVPMCDILKPCILGIPSRTESSTSTTMKRSIGSRLGERRTPDGRRSMGHAHSVYSFDFTFPDCCSSSDVEATAKMRHTYNRSS